MPCLVKGLLKGADPEGVLSVGPSPEEGCLKALQQGRHHRPLSSGPNTGSPKQANNWSSGQGKSGSSAQDQPHTQHPAPLVMCPEHFVGRIGQVVGKLCCGATKEASALVKPRLQVLGPLGIVHLLEGVTNTILKVEAKQEQTEAELMELNMEALKQLAEKEKPARAHIAGVQRTLLKGYERVLGDEPSRQETLFSLRAVGCFETGLHQQTIEVCAEWLNHIGTGGHAVWAIVLTAYAQLQLAEQPHKLRQVADDLVVLIKLLAEHPDVQLASIALPGLPSDVKGYVSHVETVVSGVRAIADAWDSAISPQHGCHLKDVLPEGQVLHPLEGVQLRSDRLGVYSKPGPLGRCTVYPVQAFLAGQSPCSSSLSIHFTCSAVIAGLAIVGQPSNSLGAINAARQLLDLTHFALDHHPHMAHDYIARAKVEDWTYQQSCYLPRMGTFMPGHHRDRRLSLEDYRLLCNNQLGVKAHGTRVNRMVKQTFTKWCDAFGRHAGLEMPQVAHLVEEAVQAQVVLMTENRRDIHRDAKAGPDFGSVVYGSTQQALAFIPPADPLPAPAAASGHAAGASGTGTSFASGAFQSESTPSGSAPPNRPFTRQGTSGTTPRAHPQNRGFRRPFSRSGTAGPSEDTSETASSNQANKWSSAQGESSGSAQTQPRTQAETPAAAAATKSSSGGSPFTFSWTQGTAEGPPAAEAAMPGNSAPTFPTVADWSPSPPPDTGKAPDTGSSTLRSQSPHPDTGKAPAFGTPGWSPA
ncbi:hypothetical protein WJX79_000652 [Trebouxia sp. C0005]